MTWRDYADEVLRPLFAGREPTAQEIKDAYPFGERAMWPYKVWLQEVKWFKKGCPAISHRSIRTEKPPPPEQMGFGAWL